MNAEVLAAPYPGLFIDGFEQYKDAKAFVGEKGIPLMLAMARGGYQFLFHQNQGVILGECGQIAGRTSSMALLLKDISVRRTMSWTGRYFSAGCAVSVAARNAVLTLAIPVSGNRVIACAWLSPANGIPYLNGVMGGSSPTKNIWYYFEIVLDRQNQTMSLIINNRMEVPNVPLPVEALNLSTVEVQWGTFTSMKLDGMGDLPDIGGIGYFDDIYARDGDRFGSLAIATRFPSAQTSVQWIPAPAEYANWQAVSLVPPQPLDVHVSSETMGATDNYVSSKPLVNDLTIMATGLCVMVRKSPILGAKLGVYMGDNSAATRREGSFVVNEFWQTYYQAFAQELTDTRAGIEAAPFGIFVAPP